MTDIDRYLTPQRLAELRTTADNANYVVLLKRVDALALLDAADNLPGIIRQAKAEALEAARGPYRCCPHCADDSIHDVEKDDHKVPCQVCQNDEIRQAKADALEEGDGYHTHEELYEYRMLYNAHAARGWLSAGVPVVKSWRHSDGELCFGGGWFVVYADLPAGQVSNHYRAEHWDLFDVPAVELPPEYDGHTPAEAANRLRAHLIERGGRIMTVIKPTVTDEMVEEAAEKSYDNYRTRYPGDPVWRDANPEVADAWLADTRAALEAAAPLIAAQAWEEGYAEGSRGRMWDSPNPYQTRADAKQAAEPIGCPDTHREDH